MSVIERRNTFTSKTLRFIPFEIPTTFKIFVKRRQGGKYREGDGDPRASRSEEVGVSFRVVRRSQTTLKFLGSARLRQSQLACVPARFLFLYFFFRVFRQVNFGTAERSREKKARPARTWWPRLSSWVLSSRPVRATVTERGTPRSLLRRRFAMEKDDGCRARRRVLPRRCLSPRYSLVAR